MSVQVETLEHNMAKLTVTVPAEKFDEAIHQTYLKMKNQISAPGFRKGKVPQHMVEKMYGAGIFYEEAANSLIPDAYNNALAEVKDIEITSQPSIEVVKIGKGEDFVFTAEVATKPEAVIGQYKGIEVAVEPVEVTDEEVDDEIKRTQSQNGRTIDAERPAENGDTVVIDYVGTVDGVAFDGGTADGQNLVLGSGAFIPGFEDQLVGAEAGAEVDVNVTFPEDYHEESLAGKPALFKVKVNKVTTRELPELNDEFAQDVSEFDTFEEYKADVRKKITERKENLAMQEKQQKVVDAIIEDAEIDIPEPMVETQARQMVDNYAMQLAQSGLSIDMYYKYTGMNADSMKEQFKPQALKNIQSRLVLEAVAKAEGMEVSDEDLEKEYASMAQQYNMEVEKVKELMGETDLKVIKSDILADKALKFVGEAAVEVAPTEVEAVVDEDNSEA